MLPGALLVPSGFTVVIVASQFPPLGDGTATLATPLVVGLAGAGFVLGASRRLRRIDRWPVAAALAAFASYACSTVLSGSATFAGYIKLDDTATYLAMLDRVETNGRDLTGLAPSTYEATWRRASTTATRSARSPRSAWSTRLVRWTPPGSGSRTSPSSARCSHSSLRPGASA